MALNDRQKLFVKAYLANGCNATQAAVTAGYSAHTSEQLGYQLLQNPSVRASVNRGLAKAENDLEKKAALLGVTRERMIEALSQTAFSSIKDLVEIKPDKGQIGDEDYEAGGLEIKTTDKWKPGLGKVIKKIAPGPHGIVVEFENRQPARELLCKMLGWTKEQLELTGKDGGPIETSVTPTERKKAIKHLGTLLEETEEDEDNGSGQTPST